MTRWHDDDVAGRLIKQMESGEGEKWEILSLPALAKSNDRLGREPGEALWPEWFDKKSLETTKKLMPSFEWEALYQQSPLPEEGTEFKRDWFKWYTDRPEYGNFYITFDAAVTPDSGDYTCFIVWQLDEHGDLYAVDHWRGQVEMDEWVNVLLNLVDKWNPSYVVSEVGIIRRASEPFIRKRMKDTGIRSVLKWLPHVGDKSAGCAAFRGMASMGEVYFPSNKSWATSELLLELLSFPAGINDDQVDACGLIGRTINETWAARVPVVQKKKSIHAKPTLDELIAAQDRQIKNDERI